jgi:hypothetical protein
VVGWADAFFPRLKEQIEGGAEMLRDTLSRCRAFGRAKDRWDEVIALTERSPDGGHPQAGSARRP